MACFATLAPADQLLGSGDYSSPLGCSRSKKHGPDRVKRVQCNTYLSHDISLRNVCNHDT